MEIKVVFPAPFCPNRANISSLYKFKLTPLTAFLPSPNIFFISLIFNNSPLLNLSRYIDSLSKFEELLYKSLSIFGDVLSLFISSFIM